MTGTVSLEDRYKAAMTEVRLNSDVQVFDNYPTCCGSCASYELEQEHPDADYVYFINEQGNGLMFKEGKPYHFEDPDYQRPDRYAERVWFNHSTLHAATILRDALVKFGIEVDWNGTEGMSVGVKFS